MAKGLIVLVSPISRTEKALIKLANASWRKIYLGIKRKNFATRLLLIVKWIKGESFEKRGYPASIVQAGHHRAQLIDRQSSLQTSQKEHSDRISFTLKFHPHNHSVKSIILKNFKLLKLITKRSREWYYLFATSTHFIQTRQKHRQLFSQKFIPN